MTASSVFATAGASLAASSVLTAAGASLTASSVLTAAGTSLTASSAFAFGSSFAVAFVSLRAAAPVSSFTAFAVFFFAVSAFCSTAAASTGAPDFLLLMLPFFFAIWYLLSNHQMYLFLTVDQSLSSSYFTSYGRRIQGLSKKHPRPPHKSFSAFSISRMYSPPGRVKLLIRPAS